MDKNAAIVREFYDNNAARELARLANRPEFIITCRMLDRYIQPGDRVLDIGGGPGRYSLYYAAKDCSVTLLDLSPACVELAQEQAAAQGLSLQGIAGDARLADELLTEQFDHVLLMGPLYHLLEEKERSKAVAAALKLLKPGGILYVSFISVNAGIIYYLTDAPQDIGLTASNKNEMAFLNRFLAGASIAGTAFTEAFFIAPGEILPFMERFPLEKLHLFGQESLLSLNEAGVMAQSPEVIATWLDIALKVCEREDLLSWSQHLMYIGRKKDTLAHQAT
ncbi:MAG: class I SAM-dependent methyltransferase [Symbiobacteriaceae bacterium]|nr:class I SAM-dependent methyltransferase [Symbiobacteriaceae bacterium]